MGQHFKTIHNRHHYIQKNKRNTCALLLQDFQTFTAVYRLKNPVLPAKHRRQNLPIDFGIIHDQYLLFSLRLFFFDDIGVFLRNRTVFCDNTVFLIFCLIHQTVCSAYRIFNRFIACDHTSDAGREPESCIARYFRFIHCLTDFIQQHIHFRFSDPGKYH